MLCTTLLLPLRLLLQTSSLPLSLSNRAGGCKPRRKSFIHFIPQGNQRRGLACAGAQGGTGVHCRQVEMAQQAGTRGGVQCQPHDVKRKGGQGLEKEDSNDGKRRRAHRKAAGEGR